MRDWFYSFALLLSIAVPIIAVSIIINLRASMLKWHSNLLLKDRESRCLTIQRPSSQDADDDFDRVVFGRRPLDEERLPSGIFGEKHRDYFRNGYSNDAHLPKPLVGAFGYREHSFSLEHVNQLNGSSTSLCRVRSVEANSPALSSVRFLWREIPENPDAKKDSPFHGDGIGEVLLHESLATRIGLESAPPPGKPLYAEIGYSPVLVTPPYTSIGFDPAHTVRVVGVFVEKVPEPNRAPKVHVFVSHSFVNQIKLGQWYPVPYHMGALWGPIPEGKTVELKESLSKEFENVGVRLDSPTPVAFDDRQWLSLARDDDEKAPEHGPLKLASWNLAVARAIEKSSAGPELWPLGLVNALWGPLPENAPATASPALVDFLREQGLSLTSEAPLEMDGERWWSAAAMANKPPAAWPEVQRALAAHEDLAGPLVRFGPRLRGISDAQLRAPKRPLEFERIDLEVKELKELVDVSKDVTGRLKLQLVDDERVKSAIRALQTDDGWRQFQRLVLWVTALLSVIALSLALSQRIYQKTSEIGIMRAFGAPFEVILGIFFIQTFFLWVGALVSSLLFAPPIFAPLAHSFEMIAISSMHAEAPGAALTPAAPPALRDAWRNFDYHSLLIVALIALLAALLVTLFTVFSSARVAPARALKLS